MAKYRCKCGQFFEASRKIEHPLVCGSCASENIEQCVGATNAKRWRRDRELRKSVERMQPRGKR